MRREKQVQYAQKLESLGVLAGGIAHEFNNLLTSILGNADLALMELSPASPVRGYIEDIGKSSRRAADLTSQMLAYSGKGKFVVETIDLIEIVKEMVRLVDASISKKAILKFNFADELPSVKADIAQIRQVIMNLITNASEAIGDKSGYITLTTGIKECDQEYFTQTYMPEELDEGKYVFLEVSDTGSGMDEETMKKVFDPFFTTKFTGRGLGMAAVLGIIRGHKGAIRVESQPGEGSTFTILFPAVDKPARALQAEPAIKGDWRGSGTVLLVDDEDSVRKVCKRMLEKLGYTVILAGDGAEAVELGEKRQGEIVFVLLDLAMPVMDGEETFHKLRRIRKDIRIILSSGYSESEVQERFTGYGIAGFIQKPFQLDALKSKIRSALNN